MTLVWVTLALVSAIVEVSIPHFGIIFVSLGAIAAAVAAYLGAGLSIQIAGFVVVLGGSVAVLRPRMMARLSAGPGVPSRTETLIGRDGVVTVDIDPTVGSGRVNVGGQDWAARSPARVSAGTRVHVVGADGIVLEVTPA